ncbi:MAG: isopeptide-forming domain-containing fimbrial protein [Candidatus Binatia bacterium]|nr:isopeptide-forming domain-containing fimbrial protein [Candidatus Binatia bacterium]
MYEIKQMWAFPARLLLSCALVALGTATAAVAAPVPTASLSVPGNVLIGESFTFTISFDNTSPSDVGYGPYIDLELPTIGADGAGPATDDGITFVSATYLTFPVTVQVLTCPVASHPYTGLPVTCTAGNQLVVMELPFGSFTNDQPPADITVNATLSNLADLGVPLPIRATGGFRFGADPLDNPTTDPPILGATQSANVTPTLLTLAKSYNGPEDETATGPNFPRRYTITVDVANGQTLSNLDVADFLPNNLAFLSVISFTPGTGSVLVTPPIGVAANPPNNRLTVRFPAIVGGAGPDATVVFEFFVPQFDANGNPVIDPNSGDDVVSVNQARAEADWVPIDSRDPTTHMVEDPAGPEHILNDRSVAIQKSVAFVTDMPPAGLSPGDVLEYTLEFQISDFFAFTNLRVEYDTLSDGQRFDTTFTPTLSVTENGATSSGPFDSANYSVTLNSPGTGTSDVWFNISGELITRGFSGRLLGGLVPDGGAPNDGPTVGTIRYRAYVLDQYSDNFPSGDPSLNSRDSISNAVRIVGDVLNNATLTPTGFDEDDGSSAGLTVPIGTLTKSIYARNGVIGSFTQIAPGDTVTFRLHYVIPTGDVEALRLVDWLPLPVLLATEVSTFNDVVSSTPPAAGTAHFGPADTFRALSGIVPTVSVDSTANSVEFTYGTFANPANTPATVDILFTVTVSAAPFADRLFLTNQVRAYEQNTVIERASADAIVQFQLTEPVINWSNIKGAVASSNPLATFSPPVVGPVSFTPPGSGCPRFSGTIHSNGLSTNPIRSDVANVDAGDLVTFAIVVENTGTGLHGAFDVRLRDTLPPGFSIPPGGPNLCVTDGTGAPVTYVPLGAGLFDPAGGIELVDPGPTSTPAGALDPYDPANGRNVVVITFDLRLDGPGDASPVTPRKTLTNTATLFNYAGAEGGPDHTINDGTDTATATTASPAVQKLIQSIVPNGTGGSSVTAGDVITYAINVTLPEGRTPGLTLTDRLPAGFEYVTGSVTVIPGTFNGSVTGTPSVAISGSIATGQIVTISFGDVTVNADNDPTTNTFQVTLAALVRNVAQNSGASSPQTKTNRVDLNFTGNPGGILTSTVSTTFREPRLTLSKSMSPANPDAGDLVTITLTVTNTGTSQAHDIVLTDTLPTDLFDPTPLLSVNEGTTPTGFVYAYAPPTVAYTGGPIPAGATRTFTFTARVRNDVVTGSTYVNGANVVGDSQAGSVPEQRSTTASATASATVPATTASKAVQATSEPSTDPGDANVNSNPPVAIGEVVTFRLHFTIPEGITRSVTLADALPSGLQHIPGTAYLSRSSTALTSAANPGNINSAAPGVPVPVTLSGTTGEVTLALGDVTNADNNNTTSEQYTLTLNVVVENSATNNAGTNLTNVARIRFLNFNNVLQQVNTNTRTVHVAEPILQVDKSAAPLSVEGGDTVTFTLVIANAATGTNAASAFNWTVSDPLPSFYTSPAVSSVNPGSSGATVAAGFVGNTLTVTIDQLDPGESVTVVYTAVVVSGVPFNLVITNTATAAATSLPGTNGTGGVTPGAPGSATGERTGSGGVNDLTTADSAQVTAQGPALSKNTVNPQPYVPVEGTATFRIVASAPIGTTTNFVVSDTLATGLSYVLGSLTVTLPPGATASNAPLVDSNASFFTQSGNNLQFNFGNLTVPASGNIEIVYDVQVQNVLSNQDGVLLGNSASMSYFDPNTSGTVSLGPVSTPDPVRVGEPNLNMTKVVVSGGVGADAGDTVRWRVRIENTGHTTAYQLDWRDVLPDGLYQISNVAVTPAGGNVFLNGTSTTVTAAHAVVSTTTNSNDTISVPLLQMEPGASLEVEFDSVLMNTVTPGQVLNNATRASYTSLVGGGRDNSSNPGGVDDDDNSQLNNYEESASQSITVASQVAVDKTVGAPSYTIGEEVVYTIRISLIEGTTPSLVLTDILPVGLTYTGHTISFGHMGMVATNPTYNTRLGSGQTVQFQFGDVVNPATGSATDDFVDVQIRARVDNAGSNQNGTVLRNGEQSEGSLVTVDYGTGTPTTVTFDHDAGTPGVQGVPVTVVEPELEVEKTVSPPAQSLGDEVQYTITVRHLATSTSTAYDIVIQDTLPSGLSYIAGSATLPPGDVTVSGQNLTFRIAALTVTAGSTSFTYRARVETYAVVGDQLTNNLAMTWTSLPGASGAPDSGRDGSGGVNDYVAGDSASVTVGGTAFIDAIKTVVDLNGVEVLPNDVLEYTVQLVNGSESVDNVVFTDVLPPYVTYVPGTLTSSVGTATFSGGTITATIPNLLPAQVVTITFRVTVDPGTPKGTVISNQGLVDSDQTSPEPTDWDGNEGNGDQPTVVIVKNSARGRLRATKTVGLLFDTVAPSGTINAGDTVQYQITLFNDGPVTVEQVSFTDVVPLGPPGVVVTAISTTQGTAPPPSNNVVISDIGSIPPGGTVRIFITGVVNGDGLFCNQGLVQARQPSSTTTDENGNPNDGAQPTCLNAAPAGMIGEPELTVDKSFRIVSDSNLSGGVNPGEVLEYTLTIVNRGSSSATDVRVDDTFSPQLVLIPGSVVTSQGAVVSENPLLVNIGILEPGDVAVVRYLMTLGAASPGTLVQNTATARDAEGDNASDSASFSVQTPFIDLSIEKSHTGTFRVGETATYTLVVRNVGMLPTSGTVTVTDSLPNGLTYVSATGAGWSCNASGPLVTCTHAGVLSPGESRTIVLQVSVRSAAYPTVTNTATVNTPGDANSANNTDSDATLIRLAPGGNPPPCGIDLRKSHTGTIEPNAEVVYTLSWTTDCAEPLVDLILTDVVPGELEIVSVTSTSGTVSVDGQTVTIRIPNLSSGPAQMATIRVQVRPSVPSGTLVENTAVIEDVYGRRFSAQDSSRVRGLLTTRKRCFLRAQRYAAPGRYITYTTRYWSFDPGQRRVSLELPDWLEVQSIFPAPSAIDRNLYIWDNLPPTAGKVRITTKVSPDAPDGLLLPALAEVTDSGGAAEVGRCTHESVVRRPQKLFGSLKANSKIFPNAAMTYAARYRNGVEPLHMSVVLPSEVQLLSSSPEPVRTDGNVLFFENLPPPAGIVKIKVQVGALPAGAALAGRLTLTDGTGTVVESQHTTEVRAGNR